jgi:cysteine-S-conjugate beta-lyase
MLTVGDLRAAGSLKWTRPGPEGYGAFVAEMDFGTAPAVSEALAGWAGSGPFGYLPDALGSELAEACATWQSTRHGWPVDPAWVHPTADVIAALEVAIDAISRAGSPVILPTPAYMPFLLVPPAHGREILQVPMTRSVDGRYGLDLDALDAAFAAGGHLLVLCNPYNPVGRVFTRAELAGVTEVVERWGGRVFADEIHAAITYPGHEHVPYASTSEAAARHTVTAVSASKAFNLPGLKCAQVVLTNPADRAVWGRVGHFAEHGASNPGVVANIAAFRHGDEWLDEVLAYLDGSRLLLQELVATHLPGVDWRSPEGTYLAWFDLRDLDLGPRAGDVLSARSGVLLVDGAECGGAGIGFARFTFATPRPVMTEMVQRLGAALGG